jgi:hypothetical protein
MQNREKKSEPKIEITKKAIDPFYRLLLVIGAVDSLVIILLINFLA